jgi:hypothetical protein
MIMNGISVDINVLLINGVPQSLLMVLALHIFTETKIDKIKYFVLSAIYLIATYLIRLLPIALGVNSVLSLIVIIFTFQFAYKAQLSQVIRTIVAATVNLILVAVSEVLNMLLLTVFYGKEKAMELFNSSDGLQQSIYTIPSTLFFACLIFAGYMVLKLYKKR